MKASERNELARTEVLGLLAGTPAFSFQAETLQRRLQREFAFTLSEVINALTYLVSGNFVKTERGRHGASLYYQVTREGILDFERSF